MKKKSLLSRSSFSSSPRATIIISKLAVTTYLSRNDSASTLPRLSSSSRSFISHYYVVPKIRSSFNFQHAQFSLQSPARAEKNFFTPVIFLIGEIIVGDHVVGPPRPLSAPAIYRFDPNEAEAFTVCRTPKLRLVKSSVK